MALAPLISLPPAKLRCSQTIAFSPSEVSNVFFRATVPVAGQCQPSYRRCFFFFSIVIFRDFAVFSPFDNGERAVSFVAT
jgi:hypothetical protein